jgi:hypothetical protein
MSELTPNPTSGDVPDPNPVLNYRTMSTPAARSSPSIGFFMFGLLAGVMASIVVYALTVRTAPRLSWAAVPTVLAGKIVLGIYLIRSPRTSSIGKGILCSIGMVMLLVGTEVGYLVYRCFNP